MNRGEWIWQQPDWPDWRHDGRRLNGLLAQVHRQQGHLLGRMREAGFPLRAEAALEVLTDDVLKTSEIEGEHLDPHAVRSSLARRLGMDVAALASADRHVDGVVDMVLDATSHFDQQLTEGRLFGWHSGLFPDGFSGMSRIRRGQWRDDASGPMQVVSGPVGRQRVHYQAPPADRLAAEMAAFLTWFEKDHDLDPLLKAGLAHLWFVTIHPFDDGNGRIARAVGDLALARVDRSPQRFYSMSAQIQRERKEYYEMLESTQRSTLDVTRWLEWFLSCLLHAITGADSTLSAVRAKAGFWQRWAGTAFNERQIKLLNRLLDGFDGKLTSTKWAAIAKCSPDTALRDITDLVDRGVLARSAASGRSTSYDLTPGG